MQIIVEIIPDPEEGGFTACVPDIPAYGEGETESEAIDDMKEALKCFIEAYGVEAAIERISSPAIREIDIDFAELARG